jgi:hypothetical protein
MPKEEAWVYMNMLIKKQTIGVHTEESRSGYERQRWETDVAST